MPGTDTEYYTHLGILYKKVNNVWYQRDPVTGQWIPIAGNPPGYHPWYYPANPSQLPATAMSPPSLLNNTGIVPDANGQVSPVFWFSNVQAAAVGALTADDRVDFYMFIDARWVMPTDTDATLLSSIGAGNVNYYTYAISDGLPDPAIVCLSGATIRDVARFVHALGIDEATIPQSTLGPWKFVVSSDLSSMTIRFRNSVAYTISLN